MSEFYHTDEVILYNGDCIDEMNKMAENNQYVDKVITSPPYNLKPHSLWYGKSQKLYDEYTDDKTDEEYEKWIINIFNLYDKIINHNGAIIWNQSYGTQGKIVLMDIISRIQKETAFDLADIIAWKKPCCIPINTSQRLSRLCEFVFVFARKGEMTTFTTRKKTTIGENGQTYYENIPNFIETKERPENQNLNKAVFPVDFVQKIIDIYVRKDDIVLDNFSGTGTTNYVCLQNNIKSIGIELSKAQCEYAKKRLSEVQMKLF